MQVLIAVDLLNGFLQPRYPLYCGDKTTEIIPRVAQLARDIDNEGGLVICVRDSHDISDNEFKIYPPHCLTNTAESLLIHELAIIPHTNVFKNTVDAFYLTDLGCYLPLSGTVDNVIIVGVCTDICVLYTVEGLVIRGYDVTVYSNCVGSFDQLGHEHALRLMEKTLKIKVEEYNGCPEIHG